MVHTVHDPPKTMNSMINSESDLYDLIERAQYDNFYTFRRLFFRQYHERTVGEFAKELRYLFIADRTTPDWIIQSLHNIIYIWEKDEWDEALRLFNKQQDANNYMKVLWNVSIRERFIKYFVFPQSFTDENGVRHEFEYKDILFMGEIITFPRLIDTEEVTTWHFIEDLRPIKI